MSPRSKKPFLGPGIWGRLFWSLLRRAYRAPVSRLRELKHEPIPESLTCNIIICAFRCRGQNKVSHVVITTDVMDSPVGGLRAGRVDALPSIAQNESHRASLVMNPAEYRWFLWRYSGAQPVVRLRD
jgi:hypothetical protein